MSVDLLDLSEIKIDAGTQCRTGVSDETVATYSEDMGRGDAFPPIVVFFDGVSYYLADGFHRYFAYQKTGHDLVDVEVINGTKWDALVYAAGANASHGLPRTNADKRRSVLMLLNDSQCQNWSLREIAKACKVSHTLVSRIKEELSKPDSIEASKPANEKVDSPKTETVKPAVEQVIKPAPELPSEPVFDERDSMIEEMRAEIQRLQDRLADKAFQGTEEEKNAMQAEIQELRASENLLERQLNSANISAQTYMQENAELKRQVSYWQKRAQKLEKAA